MLLCIMGVININKFIHGDCLEVMKQSVNVDKKLIGTVQRNIKVRLDGDKEK